MTARRVDHLLRERDRLRMWQSALAGILAGLLLGALLYH